MGAWAVLGVDAEGGSVSDWFVWRIERQWLIDDTTLSEILTAKECS
jgi:hypothetical protein